MHKQETRNGAHELLHEKNYETNANDLHRPIEELPISQKLAQYPLQILN